METQGKKVLHLTKIYDILLQYEKNTQIDFCMGAGSAGLIEK